MYKSTLLLIFLGLIIPLLNTKSVAEDASLKSFKTTGKSNNAEESLDFWDFDPSSGVKSQSITGSRTGRLVKKAAQPHKVYATKTEKKELKQLNNLLEEVDRLFGQKQVVIRQLSSLSEGNAEDGLINEEDVISNAVTEADNVIISNDALTNTTIASNEDTTPVDSTIEDGKYEDTNTDKNNTTNVVGDVPTTNVADNSGMATVTVTGYLRYDMNYADFLSQDGQKVFLDTLSKVSGVKQDDVKIIEIRSGSVIIDFQIVETADADSTSATTAKLQSISDKFLTGVKTGDMKIFGADILDSKSNVFVQNPTVTKDPLSGRNYVLGAALLVAIVLALSIFWFLYRNRKSNQPKLISSRQQRYRMTHVSESRVDDFESGRQNDSSINKSKIN